MTDILPEQVTGTRIKDEPLIFSCADMEMVMLVDYKPGSKLDLRLGEIERKLDHIFALLVASPTPGTGTVGREITCEDVKAFLLSK